MKPLVYRLKNQSGLSLVEVLVGLTLGVAVVMGLASLFQTNSSEMAGAFKRFSERSVSNSLFGHFQKNFASTEMKVFFASVHAGEEGRPTQFPLFFKGCRGIGSALEPCPGDVSLVFAAARSPGVSVICSMRPTEYHTASNIVGANDLFFSDEDANNFEETHPNARVVIFSPFEKTDYGYVYPANATSSSVAAYPTSTVRGSEPAYEQFRVFRTDPFGIPTRPPLTGFPEGTIDFNKPLYIYDSGKAYTFTALDLPQDSGKKLKVLAARFDPDRSGYFMAPEEYLGLPQYCYDRLPPSYEGVSTQGLMAAIIEPLTFRHLTNPSATADAQMPSNYGDNSSVFGARLSQLELFSLGFSQPSSTATATGRNLSYGPCTLGTNTGDGTVNYSSVSTLYCNTNQELFNIPGLERVDFDLRFNMALGGRIDIFRYILNPTNSNNTKPSACQGASDCDGLLLTPNGEPPMARRLNNNPVNEVETAPDTNKFSYIKNRYLTGIRILLKYVNGQREEFYVPTN